MGTVSLTRPAPTEHHAYFAGYISLVPDGDFFANMESQARESARMLRSVSEEKSQFRYAPGKWTIRELLGHLIDSERVFMYRALTFARSDPTNLPSFDENMWAKASNAAGRSMKELIAEFEAVRAATLAMLRGFTEEQFARSGIANNNQVSVRALAYITAGHERHHIRILREKYGVQETSS